MAGKFYLCGDMKNKYNSYGNLQHGDMPINLKPSR
jgi:hypothetical protein